jgi:hypothetical protein
VEPSKEEPKGLSVEIDDMAARVWWVRRKRERGARQERAAR